MIIKLINILTILIFLFCGRIFAQINHPENIEECLLMLDTIVSKKHKDTIQQMTNEQLIDWYRDDTIGYAQNATIGCFKDFYPFNNWTYSFDSKVLTDIKDEYIVDACQFEVVVLLMYKIYLVDRNMDIDFHYQEMISLVHQDIIERKKVIALIREITFESVYKDIPSSLEQAFIQLDSLLTKKQKRNIKKSKRKSIQANYKHLEQYIRSQWRLWDSTSPLMIYLQNTESGYIHPEDFSEIIILFYYDWLNNDNYYWKMWEKEKDAKKRLKLVYQK